MCRLTSPSIRGCRSNSWQEEERRGGGVGGEAGGGVGGEAGGGAGGEAGGGGGEGGEGAGGGGGKREDREQQWGCHWSSCHPNQRQCVA